MNRRENRSVKTVWVIEDDPALGTLLCEEVQDAGLDARWMSSAEKAQQAMEQLFGQIRQVANTRGPVLILGESGIGKELVAGVIRRESNRAQGPFVPVNCAGIPETLMETELFGHANGAFTGAHKGRQGLFMEAEGGSLLLVQPGAVSGYHTCRCASETICQKATHWPKLTIDSHSLPTIMHCRPWRKLNDSIFIMCWPGWGGTNAGPQPF